MNSSPHAAPEAGRPTRQTGSHRAEPLPRLVVVRLTASEATGAALKVAGLTVIERSLKQLVRAGHQVILAVTPEAASVPVPSIDEVPYERREVATADEVVSVAALLHAGYGTPVAVVAANVVRPHNRGLEGGLPVVDGRTRRAAESAIFSELKRGDLGLVARHLNKPISFAITRHVLCHLPVTPNQVTLAAGVVGLAGAAVIAVGTPLAFIVGLALAHLQSILDGCDGELARVRFQQSDIGEWLDTVVDDALNLCLTLALGIGLWRHEGRPLFLAAGLVGAGMLLFYNVVAYRELLRQGQGGEVLKVRWWFTGGAQMKGLLANRGGKGPVTVGGLFMAFGRRDLFIFAWLVLALVGQPRLVLVYALVLALGTFVVAVGQLLWRAAGRASPQDAAR